MGRILKSKKFEDANDICIFVNSFNVDVESIVSFKNDIVLFYWEKENVKL